MKRAQPESFPRETLIPARPRGRTPVNPVRTLLALLALALLPTALAGTGPYTGTVVQGETDMHYFKNYSKGELCPDVMRTYTVVLEYAPTTDVLTLTAAGIEAAGSGGWAAVSFDASACTEFDVLVTGTQVASVASYTVTVYVGTGSVA